MSQPYFIGGVIGAAISAAGVWAVTSFGDPDYETIITDFKTKNDQLRDSIDFIGSQLQINTEVIDSLQLIVVDLESQEKTIIHEFDKIRHTVNDASMLELDSIIRATIDSP